MVQNLDFAPAGGYTLKSDDTDVTDNVPLPAPSDSFAGTYTAANLWSSGSNKSDSTGTWSTSATDYGTYYNWYAATAATSAVNNANDATTSICPAGWTLPAGDTDDGSWYYLYNTGYSGNYSNFVTAFEPVLSGYHNGSSTGTNGTGTTGRWWSRTTVISVMNQAYSLYYSPADSTPVQPQGHNFIKTVGYSVRCVAR